RGPVGELLGGAGQDRTRQVGGRDEGAGATAALEHPRLLEFAVDLGRGPRGDPHVGGQGADRRHAGAGRQSSSPDRLDDLPLELAKRRLGRVRVQRQDYPADPRSGARLAHAQTQTCAMSVTSRGGAAGTGAAGVRENRGAGAGPVSPPTSTNVSRATLCG